MGWGCSLAVKHLASMLKTLGRVPSSEKEKREWETSELSNLNNIYFSFIWFKGLQSKIREAKTRGTVTETTGVQAIAYFCGLLSLLF